MKRSLMLTLISGFFGIACQRKTSKEFQDLYQAGRTFTLSPQTQISLLTCSPTDGQPLSCLVIRRCEFVIRGKKLNGFIITDHLMIHVQTSYTVFQKEIPTISLTRSRSFFFFEYFSQGSEINRTGTKSTSRRKKTCGMRLI